MNKMKNLPQGLNRIDFPLLILFFLATLTTFLVRHNPFFWDTVQLASKQAHFFYESHFQSIILPADIDSGHPPGFGMYLALVWAIFGKTLPVSHFAMLPFLFGNLFLLYKLGIYFAGKRQAIWLPLLICADPTFATQSILVSPDAVLIFFFLLGLWAVFTGKRYWLVSAILGLGMISLRGMMVGVVLFLFEIIKSGSEFKKLKQSENTFQKTSAFLFKMIQPYLFGGLLGLAFLIYHYVSVGWIGYHPDSPWAPCFEKVDFLGFVKNMGVLVWRMLDFGRLFIWLIIAWGFIHIYKNKSSLDPLLKDLLYLIGLSILILCPSLVIHKALLAHRYILPIFILLSILCYYLIFNVFPSNRWKVVLYAIALVGLSTGNRWIYPDKVAQGWDSTLAHIPYYELREEMLDFMEESKIPIEQTGTGFPNRSAFKEIDLSTKEGAFSKKDLAHHQYIFYSNIMNDFSDAELDELESQWTKLKVLKAQGIKVILYQK